MQTAPFERFANFFGAQDVPESAVQERRRALNRVVICLFLLAVFVFDFLTKRSETFPVMKVALIATFGVASVVHGVLLQRRPNLGSALIYVFAVADPIALVLVLAKDPLSAPFVNPLLLTIIVAAGMRYGARTMYLVWSSALVALLAAFAVEPYLRSSALTLPFALMLAMVPLFFNHLVRQMHRAKAIATERVRLDGMNDVVKARSAFLGRVSHEIRSPLQSMVSALDVFELKYGGRDLDDELIGRMRRSSLLLNTQLRDLLTLAKGESGRLEMRPEPFEVLALMEAMVASAKPLADEKGLPLVLDMPREPVFVVADGARIDQVLTNLVLNSIRYTSEGSVRVSFDAYDAQAQSLRFRVTDTGPGIPDALVPTLFEPDRTITAPDRRGEGSGMGLAIVRMLTEHLGGTIAVTSRAGMGTTFSIAIPAAPAEALQATRGETTGVPPESPD